MFRPYSSHKISSRDTLAMQPGILAGRYPQKEDKNPGWADRAGLMIQGILFGLTPHWEKGLGKIVTAIGKREKDLAELHIQELNSVLIRLRHRIRARGLTRPASIESFALIREMATRTLKLRHYDTQVAAGWAMLQGEMAEMATGEGKTLASTLAAATIAFAGVPVHIITVNEYLVERDAATMGTLYQALGLTSGFVTQGMSPEQRREGYACDIVYCTNKQVAFDYLRDRLKLGNTRSRLRMELQSACEGEGPDSSLLLRGLSFAIVDEADSVLIDEAKTPLILTREIDNTTDHTLYSQAMILAGQLIEQTDFFIDKGQGLVHLSLAGQQKLNKIPPAGQGGYKSSRLREELVTKALHALYLLNRDRDYLVQEDKKVVIIDANTGRTMPDRSWERGLHQMVEIKEGCPVTPVREPLARLTYQRFFQRYLRLCGMTGTALEVSSELFCVYGLRVRKIPLHRPCRRETLPTRVYDRMEEKWEAALDSVRACQKKGRPILIGTESVADSEILSKKLTRSGFVHQVLNARQDKEEAQIVARAGRRNQVTVATNMAGRGTDIPLENGVAAQGGLHVLSTCCNAAARIDRQLCGRCARQGDPGSFQAVFSLEDELVRHNSHPKVIKFLRSCPAKNTAYLQKINKAVIRRAQKGLERRHREARRALLRYDRRIGELLAFSGPME